MTDLATLTRQLRIYRTDDLDYRLKPAEIDILLHALANPAGAPVANDQPASDELVSPDDAATMLSLSISTLRRVRLTDPAFPKPVQISSRRIGFRQSELSRWLAERAA